MSGLKILSWSSSWPRFRLRLSRVSEASSRGSDDSEALGVDLVDEVLLRILGTRPDVVEEFEECCD